MTNNLQQPRRRNIHYQNSAVLFTCKRAAFGMPILRGELMRYYIRRSVGEGNSPV
jgi:hypothetical protein